MAEIEISFAKYAQFFFTILEGGKGDKTFFVKMLLCMGQSANGKAILEQEFPKETTQAGNIRIKPNKDSNLRKYLLGKEDGKSGNDISNRAPDLEAYFDKKQYVEDLEQYENSKLKEFAKALQLEVNLNNPKAVKQAIANCYSSIIKRATKKGGTSKKSKANPIADRQNINYSYSISLDEEKDIRNICKAIMNNLDGLKRNVERVNSYKRKLVKSPDSKSNDMNEYYESHIKSKVKEFNKIYPVFVLQCATLNSKLAPKMYMNKSFAKLISITSFFISDENKEMSIDRFSETHVQVKVYDLQTYIKYSLKEIDMQ